MTDETDFRKDRRFNYDTTIFFEDLDSPASASANLRNFSRQGLYFESNERFLPGQVLIVGIDKSPFSTSKNNYESYFIKVKWFKELYDADFRFGYGAQLQFPAEDDEKTADTEPAYRIENVSQVKPRDSRRHPRRQFTKPVFFTLRGQYYHGLSQNISRGGLFIETADSFQIGQAIRLVIPQTKFDNGVMIKGEITRVDHKGIGVRFTGLIKQK